MTKYKTVKRKANVGERILITDAELEQGDYKNGSVATVSDEKPCIDSLVYVNEWERSVHYSEYEVIVGTKPRKSERISALETEVAVLKAEVEALKQAKATTVHNVTISAPQTEDARKLAEAMTKILAKEPESRVLETPNQLRWGTIKRAKAFVSDWESKCVRKISYVVNAEKRTVVALKHRMFFAIEGGVIGRGIAKCDPDDVFNADIGKAIALARALGVDVPTEFVKAVQPTEYVRGQIVTFPKSDGKAWHMAKQYRIETVDRFDSRLTKLFGDKSESYGGNMTRGIAYEDEESNSLPVIDDTDAVYE